MLQTDMDTRMPEHALILADRMSMAQSIEGRLPLMDHKIAEYVARIPARMKLKGRRLKHLQKECVRALPARRADQAAEGRASCCRSRTG